MILNFSIRNFQTIKKLTNVSFRSNLHQTSFFSDEGLNVDFFKIKDKKLKSSIINAFALFKLIISGKSIDLNRELFESDPLDDETSFQIDFIVKNNRYCYILVIDTRFYRIKKEQLILINDDDEVLLFNPYNYDLGDKVKPSTLKITFNYINDISMLSVIYHINKDMLNDNFIGTHAVEVYNYLMNISSDF